MKQFKLGLKKVLGVVGGVAIAMMLTWGNVAVPVSPAYAAGPTTQAEKGTAYLEYLLQREQLFLTGQQQRLDQAGEFVTITQQFLDELKADGKDTSTLEAALATFTSQLQVAQASHDTAKQILDAKAGFDSNGKVTEVQQARETLKSARQSMMDASQTLKKAVQDLREVVREVREANRADRQENRE